MAKRYSPELEFQVVLELLKGDKTSIQVARAYEHGKESGVNIISKPQSPLAKIQSNSWRLAYVFIF
jgi:hypothetical protein